MKDLQRQAAQGEDVPLAVTHGHWDHVGAIPALLEKWPDLPVYAHERAARRWAPARRWRTGCTNSAALDRQGPSAPESGSYRRPEPAIDGPVTILFDTEK